MSDARNSLIPAGWYPDPHGLPQQRWWSGTQWTGTIAPLQSRGPSLLSSLPGPTINAAPQTTLPATATDPSRFPSRRQLRAVTEDIPLASEQQAAAEARAEEEHRAEEAHRFEQHRQEQKRLEQLHLEQYRAEQSKLYEQHRLEMERLEAKFREEEARLTNEHLTLGSDHLAPVTQLAAAAMAPTDTAVAAAENPDPQFAAFAPQQAPDAAPSAFAPPVATEKPRAVPELALSNAANASGTISPAALSAASMPIVSMPVQAAPIQAAPVQAAPVQAAPVQAATIQAPAQPIPAQAAPVSAASSLSATPARVSPVQGHATSPVSPPVSASPAAEAEAAIPGWHPAPSSLNPNPAPLFAPQTAKGAAALASQPATTRIPTMSTSAVTSPSTATATESPFSGFGPSRTSGSGKASAPIEDKPAYQPFGMVSRTTTGAAARPERVNTLSLWIIVALPLLMVGTLVAVATQLTEFYTLFMEGGILFIFALLTLVFAARDQRQLIDSGHLKTASPAWMLLTPLAYLIARTVEVKRQSGRMSPALWLWLGVIAVIAGAAALFPDVVTQVLVASSLI